MTCKVSPYVDLNPRVAPLRQEYSLWCMTTNNGCYEGVDGRNALDTLDVEFIGIETPIRTLAR